LARQSGWPQGDRAVRRIYLDPSVSRSGVTCVDGADCFQG
jgi:hypothetical protein